ncbi:hypothetical protein ACHAXR_007290 [Thalassiosira sp. AJA248-18]
MGNSIAKSQGTLSIVLDAPPSGNYIAGQKVTGSVYAQSKRATSNVHIDAYISGKERSRVRYTESHSNGNGGTTTSTKYKYSTRQIVRMTVNLGNMSNVQAGTKHRFPFQIELPSDLPSSFFCAESYTNSQSRGYCKIDYKIKAELTGGGSGTFGNHKVEQIINVMAAPLPIQPVPNLVPPISKRIFFCCCSVGTVTMGARVANTRVGVGETAIVDFACKNQSLRAIQKVEVDVKERVHWTGGSRSNSAQRTIASQRFQPTARWQQISKDEHKSLKVKSKSPTDTYRDQQRRLLQMIYDAIHDGENRALLNISRAGIPSYQGSLITASHRLKIKIYTSGECTENPTIKIPIYLGTPSSFLPPQPVNEAEIAVPTVTAVAVPSAPPPATPSPLPSAPPAEWDDALTATPVTVGQSVAVVGGDAIWEEEDGQNSFVPVAAAAILYLHCQTY